jgi:hypothetical protein
MSETKTSTAASVDGLPTIGAGKATGHPMDAVLQRFFKDPSVTLASELQWIRTDMEKHRAIAGGQPASAPGLVYGDVDDDESENDDAVAEAVAQKAHACSDTGTGSADVRSRQVDWLVARRSVSRASLHSADVDRLNCCP